MNKRALLGIGFFLALAFSFESQAQHKGITFQAVLKKLDGTYPTDSGVTIIAQVLDPINHCVLREEEHSNKKINNGYMNLVLGDSSASTPTARNPFPILTLAQVLDNRTTRTNLKCVDQANNIIGNQDYIPSNLDGRILRIRLNLQGEDIAADFNMRAVGFAVNSEMLNSKTDDDFVNINAAKGVTKSNVESIFERYTQLDSILKDFGQVGTLTEVKATAGLTGGGTSGSVTVGLASIADKTILANTSGASASPVATSISTLLDTVGAATQGSLLYRNGSSWSVLSPGTNGQYLQTQGSGANPRWVNAPQSVLDYTELTNKPVLGALAAKSSVDLSNTDEVTGTVALDRLPASVKAWAGVTDGINYGSGKVGIGTATPRASLDVNGTILSAPAESIGVATIIDFATGNLKYTTKSCGAYQFHNLKDGGQYSFAVQGTAAELCTFTAFSNAGSGALTVHMPPNHGSTVQGTHTLYTMMVLGTHVYVAWIAGY